MLSPTTPEPQPWDLTTADPASAQSAGPLLQTPVPWPLLQAQHHRHPPAQLQAHFSGHGADFLPQQPQQPVPDASDPQQASDSQQPADALCRDPGSQGGDLQQEVTEPSGDAHQPAHPSPTPAHSAWAQHHRQPGQDLQPQGLPVRGKNPAHQRDLTSS